MRADVAGTPVLGVEVDDETRCAHYATDRDVVAIAFACCETFYPCHRCHDALADHPAEVWPRSARGERAVLCGSCGTRLQIRDYLDALEADAACPACSVDLNPGCLDHVERYFEP